MEDLGPELSFTLDMATPFILSGGLRSSGLYRPARPPLRRSVYLDDLWLLVGLRVDSIFLLIGVFFIGRPRLGERLYRRDTLPAARDFRFQAMPNQALTAQRNQLAVRARIVGLWAQFKISGMTSSNPLERTVPEIIAPKPGHFARTSSVHRDRCESWRCRRRNQKDIQMKEGYEFPAKLAPLSGSVLHPPGPSLAPRQGQSEIGRSFGAIQTGIEQKVKPEFQPSLFGKCFHLKNLFV